MFQKIKTRLLLMVIVPLAGLLYFSIGTIFNNYSSIGEISELRQLYSLSIHIENLVYEIQKERGYSSAFLGSKGEKFQKILKEQRKKSDRRLEVLEKKIKSIQLDVYGKPLQEAIAIARRHISRLEQYRYLVSELEISASESTKKYSQLNHSLLVILENMKDLSPSPEISNHLSAFINLLHATEREGIERAIIMHAVTSNTFAPVEYQKFSINLAQKNTFYRMFKTFVSAKHLDYFNETLQGPVIQKEKNILELFNSKAEKGNFNISPENWFVIKTYRIDLLTRVTQKITHDSIDILAEEKTSYFLGLLLSVAIILLSLSLSLFFIYKVSKSISDPIYELKEKIAQVANGKADVWVKKFNDDEIGDLAESINTMISNLRRVSRQNEGEQWLKLGQTQFVDLIRKQNSFSLVCDQAIRFSSQYVEALYATLYILRDDDECVLEACYGCSADQLTASFHKSQGILGQVIQDRKYIKFTSTSAAFKVNTTVVKGGSQRIVIFPLIVENRIKGVIEFSKLEDFSELQISFLNNIAERLALVIDQMQSHEQTEELLLDTQEKSKELEKANRYKSEFLANMSHELRTPLNSLLILSKLLKGNKEGNLTESQLESIEVIYKGGNDLLELINDILDLSKVEAGMLAVDPINVLFQDMVDRLSEQFQPIGKDKGVLLNIEVDPTLPQYVYTDSQRVEQILKNFLSNAFKFTDSGSVTFKISRADQNVIFSRVELMTQEVVEFSVTDTGIGIPEDKQSSIFQAFQQADGSTTRKYGGTGLGLSISQKLSELLEGEIQVRSVPGQGSTFSFYLPLVIAENIVTEEFTVESGLANLLVADNSSQSSMKESNCDILLIEDDDRFGNIIRSEGEKVGLSVHVEALAESGIQYAQQNNPQAIISDLRLPDSHGVGIVKLIKSDVMIRDIPLYVVSVHDEFKRTCLDLGACDFISKPANLERLVEVLGEIKGSLSKKLAEESGEKLGEKPGDKLDLELGEEFSEEEKKYLTAKKVMLVNADVRELFSISKLLENCGFQVTMANNGALALEKIKSEAEFDLVIMDFLIPDMDAHALIEKIHEQEQCKELPVIMMLANNSNDSEIDPEKVSSCAVHALLKKPVNIKNLSKIVRDLLINS